MPSLYMNTFLEKYTEKDWMNRKVIIAVRFRSGCKGCFSSANSKVLLSGRFMLPSLLKIFTKKDFSDQLNMRR